LVVVLTAGSKGKQSAPPVAANQNQAAVVAQAEVPAGPLPPQLSADAMQKVKKATAYLRVTLPGGGVAEGTGFFAGEPGLVFTHAHVLGMLNAKSPPPAKVEVVAHSGQPGQASFTGTILGVDRATDLAV